MYARCLPTLHWERPLTVSAVFHCLLAMTTSYISLFRGRRDDTIETTHHISQTLRLVNHDLATVTIPAVPTVAVIASLTIHAYLTGAVPTSHIHLDGLCRIISLRPGSLAGLSEHHHALVQKICRTDIEIALLAGTSTRFAGECPAIHTAAAKTLSSLEGGGTSGLASPLGQLWGPLRRITRDVQILCGCPGRTGLAAMQYQDILVSICQRLVDFAPLGGERPKNVLHDAWHLGLTAFMMTIVYQTRPGEMRLAHFALLDRLLQERLNDDSLARVDNYRPLRLWLFVIYGLSVWEGCDGRWLTLRAQAVARELGVISWSEATVCLRQFPWIDIVHKKPGNRLWNLIMPPLSPPIDADDATYEHSGSEAGLAT
jgi:hypothetical protein